MKFTKHYGYIDYSSFKGVFPRRSANEWLPKFLSEDDDCPECGVGRLDLYPADPPFSEECLKCSVCNKTYPA